MNLEIEPLSPDRWVDLVELFGRPGAFIARGCYCVCYRRSGKHDRAGFVEVARRKSTRPLPRRPLSAAADRAG